MFLGKIAEVDLTSGTVAITDYSAEIAGTYLGGLGFNGIRFWILEFGFWILKNMMLESSS
jgi:aldehyde:ferredoxin oxidoreductase